MTDHPDFAVGDFVYRLRTLAPWEYEPERVEVTGYDPVIRVVYWRKGEGHIGSGPAHLFARERPNE